MVRKGRVLSFKNPCGNNGLDFGERHSGEFAEALLRSGNADVVARVKSRLESVVFSVGLSSDTVVQECKKDPELFANKQRVVKFDDIDVRDGDLNIRVGMSATVCKGSKKSKIWTRVSTDGEQISVDDASNVLDRLRAIADVVCEEMAAFYHEALGKFLASIGDTNEYSIETQHTFLVEAGDYDSAKLFDTITTLRETANFFNVYDEGDWTPLGDLFELANARLSPEMELSKLNRNDLVTDTDIEEITDFFNSESKALTWEVTLGRHGLFAVDELTADPQTRSSRTHMVGICAEHIQPDPTAARLSSSWLVSGSYAPRLGSAF